MFDSKWVTSETKVEVPVQQTWSLESLKNLNTAHILLGQIVFVGILLLWIRPYFVMSTTSDFDIPSVNIVSVAVIAIASAGITLTMSRA